MIGFNNNYITNIDRGELASPLSTNASVPTLEFIPTSGFTNQPSEGAAKKSKITFQYMLQKEVGTENTVLELKADFWLHGMV